MRVDGWANLQCTIMKCPRLVAEKKKKKKLHKVDFLLLQVSCYLRLPQFFNFTMCAHCLKLSPPIFLELLRDGERQAVDGMKRIAEMREKYIVEIAVCPFQPPPQFKTAQKRQHCELTRASFFFEALLRVLNAFTSFSS